MTKTVIRLALLLFVIAAGFYLVVDKSDQPAATDSVAATETTSPSAEGDQVIVYYFHGEQRCPTCLKIEALSSEAVQTGFAGELDEGRVVWKVVNYEKPENAHFVQEFELYTKSLIVVKTVNGKMVEWKNLPEIWELVNDDAAFIKYVKGEVSAYLNPEEA